MPGPTLTALPAVRRQNLLAEFAGLKQACPDGVFVSLTPGNLSLWSGVIFVRQGPYAPAVLRFQMAFPDTFPDHPPLITFATDIFHPLVASSSNHMHSAASDDTAPTADDTRLPPGGFSLRHGFPAWFRPPQNGQSPPQPGQSPPQPGQSPRTPQKTSGRASMSPEQAGAASPLPSVRETASPTMSDTRLPPLPPHKQTRVPPTDVPLYEVLRYVRSAFDDAAVLDAVPLAASGDPGAWHAWRTHRRQQGHVFEEPAQPAQRAEQEGAEAERAEQEGTEGTETEKTETETEPRLGKRNLAEWNWEHVWENRVRHGISQSLSDPVLFGTAGAGDDVVRFLNMDDADIEVVKANLQRTLA